MLLCFAFNPCCPPLLQPNPIYRLWTHLLISSCHSHLLSPFSSFHPSDIFLLPFSSIPLRIPSATLLSSCLAWLDPVSYLHPPLNPLLPEPYPWWHHLENFSHVYNENMNPVSLQLARCWIAPERANRKINHCSWGLKKMVCQQTMMTVF